MNEEPTSTRTQLVYWSGVYGFAVAILYLWGYWSPFDVNILEYVSLSDIVKTAAYPIVSVFVFLAIGAVAGDFFFPVKPLQSGGGANTKIGQLLRRLAPIIAVLYMVATVLVVIFGPIQK
ncbi:MAG: hypothetical protein EOO23_05620, partial [Comamonadaceae bacterium]